MPRLVGRHEGLVLAVLVLVVCIVTAAAHWPALSAQALSFDDQQYLTSNTLVRSPSWQSAQRFLTEVLTPSTIGGYYQPLNMISLMLDCAMGGGPEDLRAFHRTSLALHVLNTALVILLLYGLFRQSVVAVLVGLLFGVHPLTVEPIAWVGERKTLLAAFFTLASLLVYVRHTRRGGWKWLGAALLLYVLAMLSKPTAAPLPILLLILDYWPLRRLTRRAVAEKVPFFVVFALFGAITVISQARTSGVAAPAGSSWLRHVSTICYILPFYLGKMAWPQNLCSAYAPPEPLSLTNPVVAWSAVGTGLLLGVVAVSARWTRALVAGGLFFLVALFPTLGFVQYTWMIAADKYLYVPGVGLLMVLAAGLGWVLKRPWSKPARARTVAVASIVALAGLEVHGVRRYLVHWQDTLSHAEYMVRLAPDSAAAHNHLGNALGDHGRIDEAIPHFREALERQPGYPEAQYNLGTALRLQGKPAEAVDYLRQSLLTQPRNVDAHYALGLALDSLGRPDEAVRELEAALRLNPDLALAHYSLGRLLAALGRLDEAVDHFRAALATAPDDPEAHCNLALALQLRGKSDQALQHYHEALRIKPDHAEGHNGLGVLLAQSGRAADALAHFLEAARLKPDWLPPANAAAWIMATCPDAAVRRSDEAVRLAERAADLSKYQEAGVLDTLAAAYASAGRFDEAVATAEKARSEASANHEDALVTQIAQRLELYRQAKAYRAPPTVPQ